MKTRDGFIQGYNAQAVVDATAQVIVADGLDVKQSDQINRRRWPTPSKPIWARSRRNCRWTRAIRRRRPYSDGGTRDRRLIAPGRPSTREGEGGGARVAAMRERMKAGGHSSPYRLRKQLPEPVFGQIKQVRFVSFSCAASRRSQRVGPRSSPTISEARPGWTPFLAGLQRAELRHLGNGATNYGRKASTELYQPGSRSCCIRLSDWLERFKSDLAED